MDLVRPLRLAGIRCAVAAPPGALTTFSRSAAARIVWDGPWAEPERYLERLVRFGEKQRERPVLFFEGDRDLLLVSRNREALAPLFRFVVAEAELVEDLVDKTRFAALARRLGLPVPRSLALADGADALTTLRLPVIVKPVVRALGGWEAQVAPGVKALRIDTAAELHRVAAQLASGGVDAMVQELVPGDETRISSYHVYVDEDGARAAEFTGRKIRTLPADMGFSTALEITSDEEVASAGRAVVERLALRGVAKLDFKRAPDGSLYLLEVNPRFTLWHHPAAKAGVNVPAVVHADLTGTRRPRIGPVRPGVRWCHPKLDFLAARSAGVGIAEWARWFSRCEAKSGMSWDDPLPLPARSAWLAARAIRLRAVRVAPSRRRARPSPQH